MLLLKPSLVGMGARDSKEENPSREATGGTRTHNLSHCSRVPTDRWSARPPATSLWFYDLRSCTFDTISMAMD